MAAIEILKKDHAFNFLIDGKPTLLLGGQIHNSSSSSFESINESFAKAAQLNFNFVISPISWKQFEVEEGKFDFSLLAHQIKEAEKLSLKIVLIWFGAFKNAKSTYAPAWVRTDVQRFPRALNQPGGQPNDAPTLSVFSQNLLEADRSAFCKLMQYLKSKDKKNTVVMVQIENEMGLLGSSRDFSAEAETAWQRAGLPDDWQHHEKFMAEAFAKYTNAIAKAGKEIKTLPMYVNAWLGPQPGQTQAGQWPSGGPSALVLNDWKEHAPDIDILTPDIYQLEALEVMAQYHRPDNALFIPESRHVLGNLFWALGHHSAIGYSMFGAEDARLGNQMAKAYAVLNQAKQTISKAQAAGTIRAVLMREPAAEQTIKYGNLTVEPKDTVAGLKRFIEVAGVDLLIKEMQGASELQDLPIVIESPADTRPTALLIQINENEFFLIGRGVNLVFSEPGYRIEIDDVEEGRFENENWIPMRNLNGDERLHFLPIFEIGCAKVRIRKFPTS
jgi:hypothetical protein